MRFFLKIFLATTNNNDISNYKSKYIYRIINSLNGF